MKMTQFWILLIALTLFAVSSVSFARGKRKPAQDEGYSWCQSANPDGVTRSECRFFELRQQMKAMGCQVDPYNFMEYICADGVHDLNMQLNQEGY